MKIIKLEFTEKEKDLILQKIDHSMYDIESINKDYIEYEIKSHGYHNLVPFVYKNYLLNHQSNIEVKENSTIKLYDKTLRPKLEIFKQLLHDKRLIELEIIEHACFFELKIVKILETCYKSQNPEKFISSLLFQYMHYFEKNVKIEVPNLQSFYVITLKEFKDAHDWSLNSYESSFLNTHVELGIPSYVLNRLDQLFNFSEKSIKIPSFYGIYGKDYYRMLIYYIQEKNLKRKDLYAKDVKLKDLKIDYLYSTFQNEKYTNDLIYLLKYLESLGFRYSSICNLTTKKYSTCLSLKRNINNLNYYCESFEILKDVLKEKNKDFCEKGYDINQEFLIWDYSKDSKQTQKHLKAILTKFYKRFVPKSFTEPQTQLESHNLSQILEKNFKINFYHNKDSYLVRTTYHA